MAGGVAKSSPALAFKAAATWPWRWACLPLSSSKRASKIPKVDGPRRRANQTMVLGSFSTRGKPLLRKFSTSVSFPGLASRRTNNPSRSVGIMCSFVFLWDTGQGSTGARGRKKTKSRRRNLLRLFIERLAATYSRRTYRTTTIGPAVFDGRVRNGNGSDHCGIATKIL